VSAATILIGVDRRGLATAATVGRPHHRHDGRVVAKRGGDLDGAGRFFLRPRELESVAGPLGVQLVDRQLGSSQHGLHVRPLEVSGNADADDAVVSPRGTPRDDECWDDKEYDAEPHDFEDEVPERRET